MLGKNNNNNKQKPSNNEEEKKAEKEKKKEKAVFCSVVSFPWVWFSGSWTKFLWSNFQSSQSPQLLVVTIKY